MDCIRQCLSETEERIATDVNKRTLNIHRRAQRGILLDHLEGILVVDLDGASHIPGNVDHGND